MLISGSVVQVHLSIVTRFVVNGVVTDVETSESFTGMVVYHLGVSPRVTEVVVAADVGEVIHTIEVLLTTCVLLTLPVVCDTELLVFTLAVVFSAASTVFLVPKNRNDLACRVQLRDHTWQTADLHV